MSKTQGNLLQTPQPRNLHNLLVTTNSSSQTQKTTGRARPGALNVMTEKSPRRALNYPQEMISPRSNKLKNVMVCQPTGPTEDQVEAEVSAESEENCTMDEVEFKFNDELSEKESNRIGSVNSSYNTSIFAKPKAGSLLKMHESCRYKSNGTMEELNTSNSASEHQDAQHLTFQKQKKNRKFSRLASAASKVSSDGNVLMRTQTFGDALGSEISPPLLNHNGSDLNHFKQTSQMANFSQFQKNQEFVEDPVRPDKCLTLDVYKSTDGGRSEKPLFDQSASEFSPTAIPRIQPITELNQLKEKLAQRENHCLLKLDGQTYELDQNLVEQLLQLRAESNRQALASEEEEKKKAELPQTAGEDNRNQHRLNVIHLQRVSDSNSNSDTVWKDSDYPEQVGSSNQQEDVGYGPKEEVKAPKLPPSSMSKTQSTNVPKTKGLYVLQSDEIDNEILDSIQKLPVSPVKEVNEVDSESVQSPEPKKLYSPVSPVEIDSLEQLPLPTATMKTRMPEEISMISEIINVSPLKEEKPTPTKKRKKFQVNVSLTLPAPQSENPPLASQQSEQEEIKIVENQARVEPMTPVGPTAEQKSQTKKSEEKQQLFSEIDKAEDGKDAEAEDDYALLVKQLQMELDGVGDAALLPPPPIVVPPIPIQNSNLATIFSAQVEQKEQKQTEQQFEESSFGGFQDISDKLQQKPQSRRSERRPKKDESQSIEFDEVGFEHSQSMPFTIDGTSQVQNSDVNLFEQPKFGKGNSGLDSIILEEMEQDDGQSETKQYDSQKQLKLCPIDEESLASKDDVSQSDTTSLMYDQSSVGTLDKSSITQTIQKRFRFNRDSCRTLETIRTSDIGGALVGDFNANHTGRFHQLEDNHPSSNNLQPIEQPKACGNPLIDQISQFAFIHGIDPKIFTDKDNEEAWKAFSHLSLSLQPKIKREKTMRRGALNVNQHSVPKLLGQEINEIRKMLQQYETQTQLDSELEVLNKQFIDQQQRSNLEFLGLGKQQNSSSNPGQRRGSTRSSNHPGTPQQASSPNKEMLRWLLQRLNTLEKETITNKIQNTVLTLTLNRYLNNQDRQKTNHINQQRQMLNQHEAKVRKIMTMFKVFKKELHFAFLFASPLVVQKNNNGFKYFPQLNFQKEFVKIRQAIISSQAQINFTKRQSTTDSIQDILAQKPMGLHFSGHGLLNNPEIGRDLYEQYKNQGDFLVLENDKGGSELVSRQQLKKMIRNNKCELEFVFVATCHSEFVGRIFQQANAKHVICIKHQNMVKDDAVIAFTETFYSMLFEQNKKICDAFKQAQLSVEISFSQDEASIFQLLLREDLIDNQQNQLTPRSKISGRSGFDLRRNRPHECKTFGPFQRGQYNYVTHQTVHLQNRAPKMPNLRGRQKDMFRVIDKLLNSKQSRLFNLIGWPGVGKSSLACSVLDYISERALLKGGSIYFNARNISMCELFIRNFNQVLISENPVLFGSSSREIDQFKQEPIKTLQSILNKISIIDGDIVLVIDNAEELIINERSDFQMLIAMMLTRVSQLKVLLTSQRSLQHTKEFKEDKITLGNLSNIQSSNLFKEVMARELAQDEINQLLRVKPDLDKYPEEQHKLPYKAFHEHHLFTLLNGNPQSIILVASLLAGPSKKYNLKTLYIMLTDQELFRHLSEEGIEETMLVSLRLSAQLSFQVIQENDPESMDLLFLLGLLPGGISHKDLDYLWGRLTLEHQQLQGESATQPDLVKKTSQTLMNNASSTWRRAYTELLKGNLAYEKDARARAHYSQADKDQEAKDDAVGKGSDDKSPCQVIILPKIVCDFSQGRITEEMSIFFFQILSEWYGEQLHQIYVENENINYQVNSNGINFAQRACERLEENIKLFIEQMQELYQDKTKFHHQNDHHHPRHQTTDNDFDTSDDSSLTDEGIAAQMFGGGDGDAKTHDKFLPSKSVVIPNTVIAQALESSPPKLTEQTRKSQQVDLKRRKVLEIMSASERHLIIPKLNSQSKDANQSNRRSEYQKTRENKSKWVELATAYHETNEKQETFKQLGIAKKNQIDDVYNHPRECDDPEEKARLYWQFAFEAIRKKLKAEERINVQNVTVNMINGKDLDFSSDSEVDLTDDDSDQEEIDLDEHSFVKKRSREKTTPPQTQEETKGHDIRATLRRRQSKRMPCINTPMKITGTPAKESAAQQCLDISRFSRISIRNTVFERRQTALLSADGQLNNDEKALVYYLANLVLLKRYNMAIQLIKKHYIRMEQCSDIFKANVRRLYACCLFKSNVALNAKKLAPMDYEKCDRQLKRAQKHFKRANCAWGLGLTLYAQAYFQVHRLESCNDGQRLASGDSSRGAKSRKSLQLFELFIEKAMSLFESAAEQFKQVNHLRGLYNTYRYLDYLEALCINDISSESPSQHQNYNQSFFPHQSHQNAHPFLQLTAEKQPSDYQTQYKKYLDFYDMQRYNQNEKISDLTIQRISGEDLSLLTEIVVRKQNISLFGVPQQEASKHGGSNQVFANGNNTSMLEMVQEIQSEACETPRHEYRRPVLNAMNSGLVSEMTDDQASIGAMTFGENDKISLRKEINTEGKDSMRRTMTALHDKVPMRGFGLPPLGSSPLGAPPPSMVKQASNKSVQAMNYPPSQGSFSFLRRGNVNSPAMSNNNDTTSPNDQL